MSFDNWPCRKTSASAPVTRSAPRKSRRTTRISLAGMSEVCHTSDVKNPEPQDPKTTPVPAPVNVQPVKEIGGRKDGTEPTRYGDWEKQGRCIDF
ncbi:MAG: succinate dehydrogenase assembly factor 4 [Pseudomonadota bacterium]